MATASEDLPLGGGVGNNTTGGTWAGAGFSVAPTKVNTGCFSFVGGGFQNKWECSFLARCYVGA